MKFTKLLIIALLFSNLCFSQSEGENTDRAKVKDVPFLLIEEAPVYPGCSGNKQARKKCFNVKVRDFIVANYDSSLPGKLNIPPGKIKIFLSFRINNEGIAESLGSTAPHPLLESEAARVISLLPKMKPATQRGKTVGVKFRLPLTFMVK